jgi:hypothetical protein
MDLFVNTRTSKSTFENEDGSCLPLRVLGRLLGLLCEPSTEAERLEQHPLASEAISGSLYRAACLVVSVTHFARSLLFQAWCPSQVG